VNTQPNQPTQPTQPAVDPTHIYLLLDRSGSMSTIAGDVIGGFNQFLADQQRDGADARITIVQFDSQDPQEVIMASAPIREAMPLDSATYRPRGGTPLLDATGLLIGRAKVEAAARAATGQPKEAIIFCTVTDGQENQSREYNREQIQRLIAECESAGWKFVYLSAAFSAYADADDLGVHAGSTQAFMADGRGMRLAWAGMSDATAIYREKKRRLLAAELDAFFEAGKQAEEDLRRRRDHK
jgi:hypothetical protein